MHALPVALFICALCHIGSVNGYVKATEDPTRVARADAAIATPTFAFNQVPDMTTCGVQVISWTYTPVTLPDAFELTLAITNENVAQPPAPSSTSTGVFNPPGGGRRTTNRRDGSITQQIVAGIAPELLLYTWNPVNVTAGWYRLFATLPLLVDYSQDSNAFFVSGNNDSCITSLSSSSSSTATNPTSSGSPTSTGGASTTSGTIPVLAASSSKVNRGAIAGAVIGGLAVVAAAIAAYFYLRYASASTASGGSSPGNRAPRKWAGLGSTDSKAKGYPSASRSPGATSGRHHSQSDSIGPMLSSHDSNVYAIGAVGISSRPSRINDTLEEEDEVDSYYSPSQEKVSSPANGSPLRSPFSESGHGHDDTMPLDYIAPLPGNVAVTRNSSTSTSSYMNNNFSRPRSHPTSPYSSPTTGEGPFSDNASSSLGQDASYPPTPSPALPSGTSQTDIPCAAAPPGSIRSGHVQEVPRLAHKGSFGDRRPVHYLIPDMPPPSRN
ncbi:hypothetical protein B0H12DRAFT_300290 [Mycena haematopus]|nr:hypothetical protein B0H12DRAFT_300290 [Mycena haematopus]